MHLYSKIPFVKSTVHFFVADDVPSIEARFKTADGHDFVVFAVHPPPPSPTEETNSKERDGDLLCVAKKIKEHPVPSLVIGDFNTVAWSVTSILFRKTSELIDARVGRGIAATFHAKYLFSGFRWICFSTVRRFLLKNWKKCKLFLRIKLFMVRTD